MYFCFTTLHNSFSHKRFLNGEVIINSSYTHTYPLISCTAIHTVWQRFQELYVNLQHRLHFENKIVVKMRFEDKIKELKRQTELFTSCNKCNYASTRTDNQIAQQIAFSRWVYAHTHRFPAPKVPCD